MRKTITGTGGMLLIQTLKDAGVEYLFTNPGSAETGIFAAIAEDGDQRLVVGKHEGLVAAMADGYHRMSGKVGVIIAHVMGGSFQLAGQLFNAQVAGSSVVVIAGDWTSELQDYRGLSPFPGLSQAESMRPLTKEARSAYQVDTNPAAITVATARALREATTPPTGPVYLSISAELLNREGLTAEIGEASRYKIERPAPARPQTVETIARRLGEARCPVLIFGDDVWREGAQAEAVHLAEGLEAPVFSSRQIFANFPTRHPLYCGAYPVSPEFEKVTGLQPDLLFLVGCQGVHGSVTEPCVMQIGPNPVLMGRHYPLDVAAQCELRETIHGLGEALTRLHGSDRVAAWARQRNRVRAYARLLIEREEDLVREHEHDPIVHPSLLEAHLAELIPRDAIMVQESSTARTTLLPLGHQGIGWTRSGGGSLGWGVGGAIGAKIAVGRERPVLLNLGDGALTYSAAGFWTMARYNTAVLTIVSNNESYQIVRHNWAREMPDSKMVREGRYPGIYLSAPATDYVALARSQGVDGERVTTLKELEPALRRGVERITRENRPYLIEVTVAREGVGADSTWHQDWQL
ncbi:MAG TPA: thiamine pyrophosphate-binding protein [Methylomirabilota bacterium]|jgi:benzoylformate decarboxylase|nr:thiamine pyrophosphate-binding protein [Methylomirabilota bacterium]